MLDKEPEKHPPERPLECTECKKPISVRYTEIVGDSIIDTSMCADCPELQRRLHGTSPRELIANQTGSPAGLECGNCGTTLEEVRRGHRLGCPDCYTVFEDVIFMELQTANRMPSRALAGKKSPPPHIGRSPGEKVTISPSSQLLALNEALTETLSREDYEQAAALRDQIKALTEKEHLKDPSQETKDEPPGQR
jgi:protein arginine kinase activator